VTQEGIAMSEQPHHYDTTIEYADTTRGTITAAGRASIAAGAPPEFGGTDDVWSPEHLLVAAVNACVMLTFRAIAANSKLPFRRYTASATGTLEKVEGRGREITRVLVRPRITVAADVDRAKVERVVRMAEKNCFISNSLKATVTVEPEIVVE
jgi:organic hydroperoxide reductase OsmC/OhrA